MTTESYAKGISAQLDLIKTMGPVYSHSSLASDFEQRSAGEASPALSVSTLICHLLAFRGDVHLSSSLINNYSVCGPPDRRCILMIAGVEALRDRGVEGGGRVE